MGVRSPLPPQKIKTMEHVLLKISSFKGITPDGKHYYGRLSWYDDDDKVHELDITYILTEEDADDFNRLEEERPDLGPVWSEEYKEGETSTRWNSKIDLQKKAIEVFRGKFKAERELGVCLFTGVTIAAPCFCLDGLLKPDLNNYLFAQQMAEEENDWEEAANWNRKWWEILEGGVPEPGKGPDC